jgi:hypothetical protein
MDMNPDGSVFTPRMALVRQELVAASLSDVPELVKSAISDLPMTRLRTGDRVAVAVGSRGIDRIDQVTFACLGWLKDRGLRPYIVPAMGSHGGATPEGQITVLEKLGISEATMETPVRPDMDVARLARLPSGVDIFLSKEALEAEHLVVINRIKPHTKFSAAVESGLCKMLTIGLGKAIGAAEFHRGAVHHSFRIIEEAARKVIAKTNLLFGLALVEDGYGELATVEALTPGNLIEREKRLLGIAARWMGRIPFDALDLLIVDFIGKNISGIGMDSNVTGRHRDIAGDFSQSPHVRRIFVRDLDPASDGNGNGIGLADVTTRRLVDALDLEKTYANAVAAISPEKAAIPLHFDTDRKALAVSLSTAGLDTADTARIVRIKNTKHLGFLQVSEALAEDIEKNPTLERVTPWQKVRFDASGNLPPLGEGYPEAG